MTSNPVSGKTLIFFLIFLFSSFTFVAAQPEENNVLQLWYDKPATMWTEALPIGNGSLGGMVFGGVEQERIQLNEETVWTHGDDYRVKPEAFGYIGKVRELLFDNKFAEAETLAQEHILTPRMPSGTNTYQTLGDLTLRFEHSGTVKNYRRSLDLQTGMAKVEYTTGGTTYTRTCFSSYPDKIMAFRFSSSQPESITADVLLSRPGNRAAISTHEDFIEMNETVGDSGGVKMFTLARILTPNGKMIPLHGGFSVTGADEILILITAATDYRGKNPEYICRQRFENIKNMSYEQLYHRHINDFRSLFDRVSFTLGTTVKAKSLPTDKRLLLWKENPGEDISLIPLYFQYGRYLLISCSRPGSLPANLQGLWCDKLSPPWNSDYHININLQMNYWPAEVTNLRECHLPLFDFIDTLFIHGKETARLLYHAGGSVAHHITDVWFPTTCTGRPVWGLWPLGEAWMTRQYWDYFLFTGDLDFLEKRAYPALKSASLFFMDYLVRDPGTGKYVSGPSTSPENMFIAPDGTRASISMGNSMDQEIIRDLFSNTITAAGILHKDKKWINKLVLKKEEMAPVKIGSDGRIMEWRLPFQEAEPGHRHMSHLYGLHPGNLFTWGETPEYMIAAEKTIEYRLKNGGGHTGWSRAWVINFYARLQKGNTAWQHLKALISKSTLPNLFDTHPPFQIDGNFGGTAGISEMLLQSHTDTISLLPAIPDKWDKGNFTGLVARGGFVINVSWDDGFIQEIQIVSKLGKKCNLKYRKETVSFFTSPGKTYFLNGDLELYNPPPAFAR